jgi:rhodanese-related sulfurtransferase
MQSKSFDVPSISMPRISFARLTHGTRAARISFLLSFLLLMSRPVCLVTAHPLPADQVRSVTAGLVKRLLDAGEKIILIDLRPIAEFEKKRLPGAVSVPFSELDRRYGEIPRFGRVLLYCACPDNDLNAKAIFLQKLGYRNIAVMPEGFPGWLQLGFPVEHGPS